MSKFTKEDIVRIVREDDVEFIRMQFTDIFGQLKNVAITASQIEKAVNNEIMIDGSSIEGFVRIQESDQYLHPDLDTFTILPWRPQHGKVARLICDVYNPDGTPFIGDPRGALRRMLKKAADMGYSFNVGPECEFFLFQTDEDGKPTTTTTKRATLTWARWIMARARAAKSAWRWKPWALRLKPPTMRWPPVSTKSISNTPRRWPRPTIS